MDLVNGHVVTIVTLLLALFKVKLAGKVFFTSFVKVNVCHPSKQCKHCLSNTYIKEIMNPPTPNPQTNPYISPIDQNILLSTQECEEKD